MLYEAIYSEFDDISNITFTNQYSSPLETRQSYSIEPGTRKYVKGYGFLLFARNLSNKCGKELLDVTTEAGLDAPKTASKNVVY